MYEEVSNSAKETDEKVSVKQNMFEWIEIIVVSLIAVIVGLTFIFKIVTIKGTSMTNTLFDGERVIITGLFYTPERGDIVVISRNASNDYDTRGQKEPIIKRVIATEGQTVDIDFARGIVYVDGEVLEEPYIREPTTKAEGVVFPVTVPENCVFVLGDHRADSLDSRSPDIGNEGMIDTRYIMGKAILRVLPFSKIGVLNQ